MRPSAVMVHLSGMEQTKKNHCNWKWGLDFVPVWYDMSHLQTQPRRAHTLLIDSRILSYWERRRLVRDTWNVWMSVLGSRPLWPHRDSLWHKKTEEKNQKAVSHDDTVNSDLINTVKPLTIHWCTYSLSLQIVVHFLHVCICMSVHWAPVDVVAKTTVR